ncbi:MAG TPA: secretin N-terminal domain-containing protein [Pyrinomonadaceae bacterium]|nr:secretin N-terminal domain-containing protein [Pyrinomonadaceae bacterium]
MKTQQHSRYRIASVLLCVCLLASSVAAFTPKGQKNYKQGLQYEAAQQWEKAAEEFSLAVAADPANSEYQLHYRRAVFNASQAFVQQGASLMEHGDFVGAYNAFRRAYGYDTSNELARSMMERAFRLQTAKDDPTKSEPAKPETSARLTPTIYQPGADNPAASRRAEVKQDDSVSAARSEELHAIQYSGDLQQFIKYLARQLKLNVVFDRDFPKRNVDVDLQDVTAAQAVDYIFLTQGLFFQKLSNRTILVAEQVKRPQYQQLVLRTFYLYNVDPNDARTLITASIPPQAGRQPVITANKSTNSITVRDTPENVRLIGELLRSIDKERAEVVMDVNIYEVSRDDLMQLGNQIGTGDSLLNLGGIQKGLSVVGGSGQVVTQALSAIPTAMGAAFIVPPTALSALQRKDNTRLVASTQVHAFDGEKSTAHIGQRVPVQTATVAPYGSVTTGDANNQPGVAQGLFGGNGYPVIQYEKTGLTLEFTPQVFPDLDVQVKMNIKSNDVAQTAGGPALTPTFTERNIEGTARIQNNRTMMIASVAQNSQSRGRQGLPVLGLVPVLGRVVSSPSRNDKQTDIVIAVTPHVMRAPSVTPQDEQMHPSGTLQTPTSDTLEAMMQEVNREEMLASARAIPTNANVELPDAVADNAGATTGQPSATPAQPVARIEQASTRTAVGSSTPDSSNAEAATFVPAPRELMSNAVEPPPSNSVSVQSTSKPAPRDAALISEADTPKPSASTEAPKTSTPAETPTPAARNEAAKPPPPAATPRQSSANSLFSFVNAEHGRVEVPRNAAEAPAGAPSTAVERAREASPSNPANEAGAPVSYITEKASTDMASAQATSAAAIRLMADSQTLRVGERGQLKLLLKTDAPLGLVALTLRLDPRVLAVRSVGAGTLFNPSDVQVTHTTTPEGLVLVTVTPNAASSAVSGAGVLLTFDVEALASGAEGLRFDADDVHLVATDGRKVLLKVMTDVVSVVK